MSDKQGWRIVPGGVEIDVMVSPKSDRTEVRGFDEWRDRLVVKLRAPPEKGEANCELMDILGEELGAKVDVILGHTQRMKTVMATGDQAAITSKLEALRERSRGNA
ncbi:MAG TPA: DUF167 domain-containing protein [Methanomassiliicoccales archaeon]|nr:DUF167 domain-containing protein [Methanomassiliicoccales archaeon]